MCTRANREEFESSVTWSAPIQAPTGFDGQISIQVNGLVCKESCVPVSETVVATSTTTSDTAATGEDLLASKAGPETELFRKVAKPFRDGDYAVEWTAFVFPSTLTAGQWGELIFTADPDATYHVYETAVDDADLSTNFVVTEKAGLKIGKPVANQPVTQKAGVLPYGYFKGKVTWRIPFMVPLQQAGSRQLKNDRVSGLYGRQLSSATSINSKHRSRLPPQLLKPRRPLASADQTMQDAAAETKWVDPITKPVGEATQPAVDDISSTNNGAADSAPCLLPAAQIQTLQVLRMWLSQGLRQMMPKAVQPIRFP